MSLEVAVMSLQLGAPLVLCQEARLTCSASPHGPGGGVFLLCQVRTCLCVCVLWEVEGRDLPRGQGECKRGAQSSSPEDQFI